MWLVVRDTAILSVTEVHHYNIDFDCSKLFEVDFSLLAILVVFKSKLAPVDLAPDKVPLPADDAFLVLSPLSQVQSLHSLGSLDVLDDPEVQLDLLSF